MTRHIDDSLLQDFHEGLLGPKDAEGVRAHLDACPRCREELEVLDQLLGGLGDLPHEAQPSRDLWPNISWRMQGVRSPQVESLPDPAEVPENTEPLAGTEPAAGGEGRSKVARRVSLPAWQLLAASIALMVLSGGTVWSFLARGTDVADVEGPPGFGVQSGAQLVSWEEAYGGYDEAVTDLENVLERGRDVLDPETIRVLEENLGAIDRAIQEAGDALRQDPASAVLQRFLAENFRKKMDLLRQAAGAIYAIT